MIAKTNQMNNKSSIELLLCFVLSTMVLYFLTKRTTDFNNLALGDETKPYFAYNNAGMIHIDSLYKLSKIKFETDHDVVLFLGNSQTHSINQLKPGEVNYVQLLADSLTNVEVMAITMPNISLQEMLVAFQYTVSKFPVKYVTIPVFMDDLREDGIRADIFFSSLQREQFKVAGNDRALIDKINRELLPAGPDTIQDQEMAALAHTPQEKVERYLDQTLGDHSNLWKNRPQLRGEIFTFLYNFRNTIFHINAQTKRKKITQRYADNLSALVEMLEKCEQLGIRSLVYVPPIRNDVDIPYDAVEYDTFKNELKILVEKHKSSLFLNLENVVPSNFWGVKNGTSLAGKPELDFMHFQYQGHLLLFQNLFPVLQDLTRQ